MMFDHLLRGNSQMWAVHSRTLARTTAHKPGSAATAIGAPSIGHVSNSKPCEPVVSIQANTRAVSAGGSQTTGSTNSSSASRERGAQLRDHAGRQQQTEQLAGTGPGATRLYSVTSRSSPGGSNSREGISMHPGERQSRQPRPGLSSPGQPLTNNTDSSSSSKQSTAGRGSDRPRRSRRSSDDSNAVPPAPVEDVGMAAAPGSADSRSSSRNSYGSTERPESARPGARANSSASTTHGRDHTAHAWGNRTAAAPAGNNSSRDSSRSQQTAVAADDAGGNVSTKFNNGNYRSRSSNSNHRHRHNWQQQQHDWGETYRSSMRISGGSGAGRPSADGTAYAALQNIRSKSFEELRDIAATYGGTASLTNLMAMFSRLKTVPSSGRNKAALLSLLWQHLQPRLQQASPRHCAEAMLTTSKLQAPLTELYVGCLGAFVHQLRNSDERILANAIYAVATASDIVSSNAALKNMLQRDVLPAFVSVAKHEHPQAVSNTVYAAALLEFGSDSLDVQQLLKGLPAGFWSAATTQELSNTLWGAAQLGQTLHTPQLQQVVQALLAKLPEAKPVHITNTLWAVATMGQQLCPGQLQQMVDAMLQKPLYSRVIGSILWSIGKLGGQIPQQQVDQLIDVLLQDLKATSGSPPYSSSSSSSTVHISNSTVFSKPQAISNALHGVATMRQTLSNEHLDQLLELLVPELADCTPQVLSNTLWAAAIMRSQVSTRHLDQIYSDLALKLRAAEPQAVANAFWAAGTLIPCYFPGQLLTQEAVEYTTEKLVPHMKPQELSNVILACGLLGHSEPLLLKAILNQTSRLLTTSAGNTSSQSLNFQGICNICWGCAVLDMQQYAEQLQQLAAHCLPAWSSPECIAADKVQLYQLHMWLVEQVGQQEGLLGKFSQQHIEECRQAWVQLVSTLSKVSYTQQTVYEAALELPELQDVQLEVTTADQLWSMDICATVVASGQQVAVEVDGPFHYRRPDRRATGSTAFRNKALAYRGYVVVPVPWWDWYEVMHGDMPAKVACLRRKLQQALHAYRQQSA